MDACFDATAAIPAKVMNQGTKIDFCCRLVAVSKIEHAISSFFEMMWKGTLYSMQNDMARTEQQVGLLQVLEPGARKDTSAVWGDAEVTTRWMGFYRVWHGSGEVFDAVDLFLPDSQFPTQVCLVLPHDPFLLIFAFCGLPDIAPPEMHL